MNSARTQNIHFANQGEVGGIEYVPPTCCLPAACDSAHAPVCVERTGGAGDENFMGICCTGHLAKESLVCIRKQYS